MRTFSVIIPAFSNDIKPTLASILQQYKPEGYEMEIEVIIVNDNVENHGKYDSIVEAFSSLSPSWIKWRIIENVENVGQGLSRQYGIDSATTDYFMLLDDDDQYSPGFVYKVSDNIDLHIAQTKRDDVAMVTIPVMSYNPHGADSIIAGNSIWVQSHIYNRKWVKNSGIRFTKETSRRGEDYTFQRKIDYVLSKDTAYCRIDLPPIVINQVKHTQEPFSQYIYWRANEKSQTRSNKHWGLLISPATHIGSCQIFDVMKEHGATEKELQDFIVNSAVGFSVSLAKYVALSEEERNEFPSWFFEERDICREMLRERIKQPVSLQLLSKSVFQSKYYSDNGYGDELDEDVEIMIKNTFQIH
jgi:glycosyltransferase involved in cell wall biosynthesis